MIFDSGIGCGADDSVLVHEATPTAKRNKNANNTKFNNATNICLWLEFSDFLSTSTLYRFVKRCANFFVEEL
jgi:hypothetical protein